MTNEEAVNFDRFWGDDEKGYGEITSVLCTSTLRAYAGWSASVGVTYAYVSAHAGDAEAPAFPKSLADKAKAFDQVKDPARNKDNAPALGSDAAGVNPNPTSEEHDGYRWVFTTWTLDGTPVDSTAITNIRKAHHFVGLWKVQLTKTHAFESATSSRVLPKAVTELTPGQGEWQDFDTTMTPTDTFAQKVKVVDGTWKFKEWDKARVEHAKSNQHFIGKWEFTALDPVPVTFTVKNCTWADGTTDDLVKNVTVTRAPTGVSGPLGNIIPTGMRPAMGYEGGAWAAPVPTADTVITAPTTFTFTCSPVAVLPTPPTPPDTAGITRTPLRSTDP